MNKFKAIIFDLDGTLADSLQDIADAMNKTLTRFGYPTYSYDEYKYLVGNGLQNLVTKALPETDRNKARIEEVLSVMMKNYRQALVVKTKLYDGIPELLDKLTQQGFKLALLSNKADELTQEIASKLLSRWKFDCILGASDHFPRKPSPESALYIAEQLEVLPSEVLYLGDTDVDMQTANAAGMFAVGVTWGFRTREELEKNGAKRVIEEPAEL